MSCTSSLWLGAWLFTWQGGRLADVCHASNLSAAVDCVDVSGEDLETAARRWVECYGATTYAAAVLGVG